MKESKLDCEFGGDIRNDCDGCAYSTEYHCVNGQCVKREVDENGNSN